MMKPNEALEATRQSLLARLKNWEDQASWQDFFNKYWRLIYTVARRSRLSDAEAQDVVQESILTVAKSIKNYEYRPERCPFRSWLLMVTRHRIIEYLRKQQARVEAVACPNGLPSERLAAEQVPDPEGIALEAIWNEEWHQNLIAAATEQVKKQVSARQFQIYDLHVLQEWPVKRVTAALKISAAQVYLAKQRVGRLMKKAIRAVEERAG